MIIKELRPEKKLLTMIRETADDKEETKSEKKRIVGKDKEKNASFMRKETM